MPRVNYAQNILSHTQELDLPGLDQCQNARWCPPRPLCPSLCQDCISRTTLGCCCPWRGIEGPVRRVWSDSWPFVSHLLRDSTLCWKGLSGKSENKCLMQFSTTIKKIHVWIFFVLNVLLLTSMNHSPAFRLCNSSQVKSELWLKILSGNLFSMSVVLRKNPGLWSCIRKGTLSLLGKRVTVNIKTFDAKTKQIQRFIFH